MACSVISCQPSYIERQPQKVPESVSDQRTKVVHQPKMHKMRIMAFGFVFKDVLFQAKELLHHFELLGLIIKLLERAFL